MDRNVVLKNHTVVVEGDRIQSLAPTALLNPPPGSTIIDGKNKYLMPGLADMHVHVIDKDQLILFIANGVTTVRNMWGEPKHLEWRQAISDNQLVGPTIYTAGAIIDGDPPVFPESQVVTSTEQAQIIVAEQKAAGYDFLKVYSNLSLEAYDALVAAASALEIPIDGHVPADVGLEHVLASRQRCIEHLDGYETALVSDSCAPLDQRGLAALILAWTALDRSKFPEIVKQTREAGTWNCPTLIVYEKWVPPDKATALLKGKEFTYLSPDEIEFHHPKNNYTNSFTPAMFGDVATGNPIRKELTKRLHEGGARILLGTDCGNPLVVPGFSTHEELQNLVEAGLTPYEAIKAGTHDAAEFFNALEEFGTVAVGSRADLILVEGNPLDDVANVGKRIGVMARGSWYPERALKARLDKLAARYSRETMHKMTPN